MFAQGMFQIDQNATPDQIKRKRELLAAMMPQYGSAKYVGQGLGQLFTGIAQGRMNKSLDKAEDNQRSRISDLFSRAMGGQGGATQAPAYSGINIAPIPADPNSPQGIANDAMVALGKAPDYAALETQYGLPSGYLARTAQIESGGNPNAQNPNSSAGGPFQFIDSTAAQYGLTDRFDPVASADAAARLAKDNAEVLRRALGREPTAAELYLAHQQGAGGAAKLLAAGDAPAAGVVGRAAIDLNGGAGMTARDFANQWVDKFNGGQGAATVQPANMDVATWAEIANSPYADPGQRAYAQTMLDQIMRQSDPMYQMGLEKSRLELDALRNGDGGKPEMVRQREELARIAGLEPGTPEYQQFMLTGNTVGRGANEYGLTPVYGTDAEGNITIMQIGKDGTAIETQLPEGVIPNLGIRREEESRAAAVGKASGEAAVALDGARVTADRTLGLIDDLYNDPYLDSMLGAIEGRLPNVTEDAARVQSKMDQLQGTAFLEAYNMLRGGGQITEVEGKKAEDAMARLKVAQGEEDYRRALMDFRDAVETGIRKLEAASGSTEFRQPGTDGLSDDEMRYLGLQ